MNKNRFIGMKKNNLIIAVVVLIAIVALGFFAGGTSNPVMGIQKSSANGIGNNKYIVGFKVKPGQSEKNLVESLGGNVDIAYTIIPALAINVSPQAADALSRNPRVAYIEPDFEAQATAESTPWGVTRIKAPQVWPLGWTGDNVKVAILDTGIGYNHPDLAPNYVGGWDFVNNDNDPMDDHGHGTHVAGTVAAATNLTDVIGVAPQVSLYGVKVLNSSGSGTYSWIIAGLQWSVTNGMQVVNMSLGGGSNSQSLKTASDNASAAGVVLVAAAGNSGNSGGTGDNIAYPAKYDSVIAVGATDFYNVRPYFSSTGPALDVVAPGTGIISDKLAGGVISSSGTSMASPHVAGTAALLIASGLTGPYNLRFRLTNTATDLGATGFDNLYGYGLVDALKAVNDTTPSPPPPPPPPPPESEYGNLSGNVYDAANGTALQGAKITLGNTGRTAITNQFGGYTINDILVGAYSVKASLKHYESALTSVTIKKGITQMKNFSLIPR